MRPCTRGAAVALVLLSASALRAQLIEVQVKSVDDVRSAARYLAPILKADDMLALFDTIFGAGGKGLSGVIDTARPFGLTVDWAEKGPEPDILVYVPLRDPKNFGTHVKKLDIPWRPLGKDVHELVLPIAMKLFGRQLGDHVFLSPSRRLLEDAARLRAPSSKPTSLVRAELHMDKVPKQFKDALAKGFESGLAQDKKPAPGESEALYRRRLLYLEGQKAVIQAVANLTKQLTLTVDLDTKKPRLAVELALEPRPESKLAEAIQAFGAGRSAFGRMHRQSLVSLTARIPLGEAFNLQGAGWALLDELEKTVDPRERLLKRRLLRAMEPSLQSRLLDAGVVLHAPTAQAPVRVLAGLRVKQGRTLEHVIRDLVKDADADERDYYGLRWNHERHAGANVHALLWQARSDQRRLLFFTLREEMALAATELAMLRKGLDDLEQPPPEDVAPVQIELHVKALMLPLLAERLSVLDPKEDASLLEDLGKADFGAAIDKLQRFANSPAGEKVAAEFRKAVPRADDDALRIKLALHGDTALRLRLDLHPEILGLVPLLALDEKGPPNAR